MKALKEVNYKLLAVYVHAELGDGKHSYIQQIIRGLAFQLLYSGKPWRKKVILEAR